MNNKNESNRYLIIKKALKNSPGDFAATTTSSSESSSGDSASPILYLKI